jgi:hypothetical protein
MGQAQINNVAEGVIVLIEYCARPIGGVKMAI